MFKFIEFYVFTFVLSKKEMRIYVHVYVRF